MSKGKRTPKRLTRRERQALEGKAPARGEPGHIHCVACGRHIEPDEMDGLMPTASWLRCQHGSSFAACTRCVPEAEERLREHDRTGAAVPKAAVWH